MQSTTAAEDAYKKLKMDSLEKQFEYMDSEKKASEEMAYRSGGKIARLTASALRGTMKAKGYTGLDVFDDNIIFEWKDGQIIYPDGMPEEYAVLSEDMIDAARHNSNHFAGYISDSESDNSTDDESGRTAVYITALGDTFYHALFISESSIFQDETPQMDEEKILSSVEEAYGGALFLVNPADPELTLQIRTSVFPGVSSLAELGITPETVTQRKKLMTLGEKTWELQYRDITYNDGDRLLIFATSYNSGVMESISQIALLILSMLLILLTAFIYVSSAMDYVKKSECDDEQKRRYRPKQLRRRMVMLGIISALVIFLNTVMIHELSIVHSENRIGMDLITSMLAQVQDNNRIYAASSSEKKARWYTYYGEKMAGLIHDRPELANQEKLQEFCDILDIDYIMLFDSDGKETVCSKDYFGFELGTSSDHELHDFPRLLMGVTSIVHASTTSKITGLDRQLIGVTLPSGTDEPNGALMMALLPGQTQGEENAFDVESLLESLSVRDTVCFIADEETGLIVYSGDPADTGLHVSDLELDEENLQRSDMDFVTKNGNRYFVITQKSDHLVFYYLIRSTALFKGVYYFSLLVVLIFLLVYEVMFRLMMIGYTEKSMLPEESCDEENLRSRLSGRLDLKSLRESSNKWILRFSDLPHMTPKARAILAFKILFCVASVVYLLILDLQGIGKNESYSLLGYILSGQWSKGNNLFAYFAVFLQIIAGILFLAASKIIFHILCRILDKKGETICHLLFSLMEYATAFVTLYYVLSHLGFPTETVLASLGIVSLALSLGAQSLVADILAGVAIVFEGTIQVGDYVVFDDFEGFVQETGVRSTKIIDYNNNVKILKNSSITGVLRKSRDTTNVITDLTVTKSGSFEDIEKMLTDALPRIGAGNPMIIEGPTYMGVSDMGNSYNVPLVTMRFNTTCLQDDYYNVKYYVNREMVLLCEKEQIITR